jgi:hypothetical protein
MSLKSMPLSTIFIISLVYTIASFFLGIILLPAQIYEISQNVEASDSQQQPVEAKPQPTGRGPIMAGVCQTTRGRNRRGATVSKRWD